MAHTAPKNLKQFQCDERGTIALIFALSVFILFWCAGLAIDGGRAYAVNSRISRSVDAASLAAARGMRLDNLTDNAARDLARKYFQTNFEASGGDMSQINLPLDVFVDRAKGSVEIDVVAKVPTTFGSVGGIDFINISKTSVAIFKATDLEISLQLDLTGSMGCDAATGLICPYSGGSFFGPSKMDELRLAAADFINILIPDAPTGQKVRIGLAPFSSGVNAGSAYLSRVNITGISAGNCTFERRSTANQTTDVAPSNALNELKVSSDVGGAGCPNAAVVALTDDKKMLISEVTDTTKYAADGSTAGHLGTAWAYYLLSPNWQNIWPGVSKPAEYKDVADDKVKKIAVLMTDGDYNTVGGDNSQDVLSIKFAKDTCAQMKDDGIIIYTVGFILSNAAKATMAACASDPGKALNAENGAQLKAAFKNIANQITTLRLSQ
jgi:Putative Flp pilus-assembly TadE/G-like/von Willebrand factor type A domain